MHFSVHKTWKTGGCVHISPCPKNWMADRVWMRVCYSEKCESLHVWSSDGEDLSIDGDHIMALKQRFLVEFPSIHFWNYVYVCWLKAPNQRRICLLVLDKKPCFCQNVMFVAVDPAFSRSNANSNFRKPTALVRRPFCTTWQPPAASIRIVEGSEDTTKLKHPKTTLGYTWHLLVIRCD